MDISDIDLFRHTGHDDSERELDRLEIMGV